MVEVKTTVATLTMILHKEVEALKTETMVMKIEEVVEVSEIDMVKMTEEVEMKEEVGMKEKILEARKEEVASMVASKREIMEVEQEVNMVEVMMESTKGKTTKKTSCNQLKMINKTSMITNRSPKMKVKITKTVVKCKMMGMMEEVQLTLVISKMDTDQLVVMAMTQRLKVISIKSNLSKKVQSCTLQT